MPSRRRIAVALYHREGYSTGRNRLILGYEAFHWGILIMPEESEGGYDAYDATDRNEIDPTTFRMENPNLDWWFDAKQGVADSSRGGRLVGCIIIGAVPHEASSCDVRGFLEAVPLPKRNQTPQQSCVTWVGNAIRALQGTGWADSFAVETFMQWALSYGDDRMGCLEGFSDLVHYKTVLEQREKNVEGDEASAGPTRPAPVGLGGYT